LAVKPQVMYCCQGDSQDKHCDDNCNPQSPRKRHHKHVPFQIMQIGFSDYDTGPEIGYETIKGGKLINKLSYVFHFMSEQRPLSSVNLYRDLNHKTPEENLSPTKCYLT